MNDDTPPQGTLNDLIARRLRDSATPLTRSWLERIAGRVDLAPEEVFPTDHLLDHVPALLEGIAAHVADATGEITTNMTVVHKARELGQLRFRQGFGLHEILKEYELLGGILLHFAWREAGAYRAVVPAEPKDDDAAAAAQAAFAVAERLFEAIATVLQVTADQFTGSVVDQLADRENRLRAANRLASHELKNRLGSLLGATQLLGDGAPPDVHATMAGLVRGNVRAMNTVVDTLATLTHLDDLRREQHVLLEAAAREARRKLRRMADEARVQVRIDPDLPEVEVPAAPVELCLANYLSNALHYHDPGATERWVRVRGWLEPDCEEQAGRVVVEVSDNGIGVPGADRGRLFTPFMRSETAITRHTAGTGLGLSTVRETVEELGGRAWASFERPSGSAFLFSLPCRRAGEGEDTHVGEGA